MANNNVKSLLVLIFGYHRIETVKGMFTNYKTASFLSLICILLFAYGSQFITIEISRAEMSQAIKESPFLRLLNFVGAGSCGRGSIFTTSVLFMIIARVLMYLMEVIVPYYRNLHQQIIDGRSYLKQVLERHMFYLDIIVALVFTIILTLYLINKNIFAGENGDFAKVLRFYFSGTIILFIIVKIIDKLKIMDGLLAVMVTGFIVSIVHWYINVSMVASQGLTIWIWLSIVTVIPVALVTAILLDRHIVKVQFEIAGSQPRHYSKGLLYIPLKPISPFGKDRCVQTFLFFIVAYIFDLLQILSIEHDGIFHKMLIGIVAPFFVVVLFSFQVYLRYYFTCDVAGNQLKREGAYISGIRPGEATINYLREKSKDPFLYEAAFLIYGLLVVQIANLTIFPVSLYPLAFVSMWAFIDLSQNTFDKLWSEVLQQRESSHKFMDPRNRNRLRGF